MTRLMLKEHNHTDLNGVSKLSLVALVGSTSFDIALLVKSLEVGFVVCLGGAYIALFHWSHPYLVRDIGNAESFLR